MNTALYLFGGVVVAAALLANISIWAPRKLWLKVTALATMAAFLPLTYASLSELLSRPKPVSLEWAHRTVPEAQLLSANIQEGKAIYLWIRLPDIGELRAYQLPWNLELAKQLQSAQHEARKHRNGVRVRFPFDGTNDPRKRMFYAPPQQSLPPKKNTDELPLSYMPPRGT